jgi:hypothetical protein
MLRGLFLFYIGPTKFQTTLDADSSISSDLTHRDDTTRPDGSTLPLQCPTLRGDRHIFDLVSKNLVFAFYFIHIVFFFKLLSYIDMKLEFNTKLTFYSLI